MNREQKMVREFNREKGGVVADAPTLIPQDRIALRLRLVLEEAVEYAHAAGLPDGALVDELERAISDRPRDAAPANLVEVYDGLIDLQYVVLGAALEHGLDLEPGFCEVHRSNMTKNGAPDPGGKITKGPAYEPPNLVAVVSKLQRWAKRKAGCCADQSCTAKSCMALPAGESCATCQHLDRCARCFGVIGANTVCDFFPRRFAKVTP